MFRSKFVNFHVGQEGTNFTVHAQPLAMLSGTLNTLINGNMVEAKTGVINWKDTDEETFIRFCEFAYVQNYTPPMFSECTDNIEELKQAETSDFSVSKKDKKKSVNYPEPRRRQLIKSKLNNLLSKSDYPPPSPSLSFCQQFEPVSNTSPNQDFTPVLVGHAQLYVLADKYDVRELKNLVLHKLNNTLEKFTLHKARIADIMELVRFAYDNTPPSSQPGARAVFQNEAITGFDWPIKSTSSDNHNAINRKEKRVDGMRKLVTDFVVSKLDVVAESDAFLDYLHYGGDFVRDFWTVLWNSEAWVA